MRRIKVLIETNKYKHGPGTFRSRLIPALSKVDGIQVTNNIKNKFNIKSENITFMSDSEKRNNLAKKLGVNVLECNPLDLIK